MTTAELNQRRGKIRIADNLIFTLSHSARKALFSQIYPHTILRDHEREKTFIIYATSPLFEKVPEESSAPEYIITIQKDEDKKKTTVEAKRIK